MKLGMALAVSQFRIEMKPSAQLSWVMWENIVLLLDKMFWIIIYFHVGLNKLQGLKNTHSDYVAGTDLEHHCIQPVPTSSWISYNVVSVIFHTP